MGIDFIPTGVATGVSGSIFAKEVVTVIAAAGTFVPAAGLYYAYAEGADVVAQVQDSGGAWNTITGAAVPSGLVISDGVNLRFFNSGVGSENVTLIKVG